MAWFAPLVSGLVGGGEAPGPRRVVVTVLLLLVGVPGKSVSFPVCPLSREPRGSCAIVLSRCARCVVRVVVRLVALGLVWVRRVLVLAIPSRI